MWRKGPYFQILQKTPKIVRPRQADIRDVGKRERTVDSQPTDGPYCSIGCISENKCEGLEWEVDVSKAGRLRFLVDTGADISLIKSTKLIGEAEFDPDRKVKVRGVDGSVVQTFGVIEVGIQEGILGFDSRFIW